MRRPGTRAKRKTVEDMALLEKKFGERGNELENVMRKQQEV